MIMDLASAGLATSRPICRDKVAKADASAPLSGQESSGAQVFVSSAILNISLAPSIQIRPDEAVFIEFDQERMHLFDGETEMALQAD